MTISLDPTAHISCRRNSYRQGTVDLLALQRLVANPEGPGIERRAMLELPVSESLVRPAPRPDFAD